MVSAYGSCLDGYWGRSIYVNILILSTTARLTVAIEHTFIVFIGIFVFCNQYLSLILDKEQLVLGQKDLVKRCLQFIIYNAFCCEVFYVVCFVIVFLRNMCSRFTCDFLALHLFH